MAKMLKNAGTVFCDSRDPAFKWAVRPDPVEERLHFSCQNEMGPGGKFARFTPAEQEAVRGAVIVPGTRRRRFSGCAGRPFL
jgi:hypothetical protein